MPTELECPKCQKRLRAGDGLLGSQALCPFCRTVVDVPKAAPAAKPAPDEEEPLMPPSLEPEPEAAEPAAPQAAAPAPAPATAPAVAAPAAPAAEQWWAQTGDGQQFGPVPKAELDGWVADGSINAECQLLRDGDEQWQWASEIYPQLAQS